MPNSGNLSVFRSILKANTLDRASLNTAKNKHQYPFFSRFRPILPCKKSIDLCLFREANVFVEVGSDVCGGVFLLLR